MHSSVSSLSLVFMACGILNTKNYLESVGRGCGSESGWTDPSPYVGLCYKYTQAMPTHIYTQEPDNLPAAKGLPPVLCLISGGCFVKARKMNEH